MNIQNNPAPAARMGPSTVGFACLQWAIFSIVAVVFHFSDRQEGIRGLLASGVGTTTLFCALLFPFFAVLSPEPANGPKLIIFSAAVFLALTPWIPPRFLDGDEARWSFLLLLMIASALGNLIILALPSTAGGAAPRTKRIDWSAGGKLFIVILSLGLAAIIADRLRGRPWNAPGVVSMLLIVIFTYFVASRFTRSPAAVVTAVLFACGAAALVAVVEQFAGGIASGSIAGTALGIGVLYSASHVERGGNFLWTIISVALMLGAVADLPILGAPLLVGMLIYLISATVGRRPTATAMLIVLIAVCVFVMFKTWPRLLDWIENVRLAGGRATRPETGILHVERVVAVPCAVFAGMLALLAIARLYKNPAALATFAAGAVSLGFAFYYSPLQPTLCIHAILLFGAVGGAVVAHGESLIRGAAGEEGNL